MLGEWYCMKSLKIGIVCVYIGPPPGYFEAWIRSCKENSSIDFIYVTDQDIEVDASNIKIVKTTLHELKIKASEILGFTVLLDSPFKLCDYKPMYGLLFQEYISSYDYWGHCDIDLIWGDLNFFFDKYELEKYDKFLPLGHLSLYKNTFENNHKFMEKVEGMSDYREIYTRKENFLFDELALIKIYERNGRFFDKIIFADIWPSKKRYTMCTFLKYYQSIYDEFAKRCNPINFKKQIFMWENGKIFQYMIDHGEIKKREYIYIHIQKRSWKINGDYTQRMIISNDTLEAVGEEISINELIERYNRYSIIQEHSDILIEFIRHCWSWFNRKIIRKTSNVIIIEKQT